MELLIDKRLGVHRCAQCGVAVADSSFVNCGIQLAPQLAITFDYICPTCRYAGRYTLEVKNRSRGFAHAIDILADLVVEIPQDCSEI